MHLQSYWCSSILDCREVEEMEQGSIFTNNKRKWSTLKRSSKECRFANFLWFLWLYDFYLTVNARNKPKVIFLKCRFYWLFWGTDTILDFTFTSVEHSKRTAVRWAEQRSRHTRPKGSTTSVLVPQEPLTGPLTHLLTGQSCLMTWERFSSKNPEHLRHKDIRGYTLAHTDTQSVWRNLSFEEIGGIFLHSFKPNLLRIILRLWENLWIPAQL